MGKNVFNIVERPVRYLCRSWPTLEIETVIALDVDLAFGADLPWAAKNDSEKRHEAEFKRRILDLSKVSMTLEVFRGKLVMFCWASNFTTNYLYGDGRVFSTV